MFTPLVKYSSLSSRVVDEIKVALQAGKLKPGDRLPSERELCGMLGVSRTSLREAMKILEGGGIVTVRHGQGVFVADDSPSRLLDNLARMLVDHRSVIKDLFEIRQVLETAAVEWVAERGDGAQIEALARLMAECLQQEAAGGLGLADYDWYDHHFHYQIAVASGNALLVRICEHMMDMLRLARQQSLRVPGRPQQSIGEHQQILEAIQRRDGAEARRRMLAHIEGVERAIREAEGAAASPAPR